MKKKVLRVLAAVICLLLVGTSSVFAAMWNSTYYIPGDVDDDGKIDGRDIVLVRRYIAGGYDVDLDGCEAADVNADLSISVKDVIPMRRYIVGGYDVSL